MASAKTNYHAGDVEKGATKPQSTAETLLLLYYLSPRLIELVHVQYIAYAQLQEKTWDLLMQRSSQRPSSQYTVDHY